MLPVSPRASILMAVNGPDKGFKSTNGVRVKIHAVTSCDSDKIEKSPPFMGLAQTAGLNRRKRPLRRLRTVRPA